VLNPENAYVAEYSPVQGCFHVETAREAMESNLRQIVGGWTNSYLPFAFCSSHDEASRACDDLAAAMQRHGGRVTIPGRAVRMPQKEAKRRTPVLARLLDGHLQERERAKPGSDQTKRVDVICKVARELLRIEYGLKGDVIKAQGMQAAAQQPEQIVTPAGGSGEQDAGRQGSRK